MLPMLPILKTIALCYYSLTVLIFTLFMPRIIRERLLKHLFNVVRQIIKNVPHIKIVVCVK